MISKTEESELEGEVNICHNIKIVNIHSLFFYIINPCTILIHVHTITKIEARVVLGMTVQICHKNHELVCHPHSPPHQHLGGEWRKNTKVTESVPGSLGVWTVESDEMSQVDMRHPKQYNGL